MEFLLKDKKIKELLRKHCYEVLEYLIQKKVNFSIVCNVRRVKFEPELPDSIRGSFSDLTVFIHTNLPKIIAFNI